MGRLAGPIIVGQLAQMATGFTDTVMAGRISPLDLGAIAVGSNLWILPFLFCLGLLMAISSMVSHYYGANRYGAIKDLMRQALSLALLLAIICVIAVRGLTGLLHFLQLDADITRVASDYVKAVSWGLPAVIGYLVLRFLSEGIGYTRPMMLIQLAGLGFNVLFNYILMFGKLGMPAMGAVGAGWATAIVMWLNLIFLLLYIATHRRFQTIWQSEAEPRDWSRILETIKLGLPIAIGLSAEVGLFAAVSLLMGKIGVLEVAAHQVAINFASIAFMIPLGIGAATTIRVGHAMGQGDSGVAETDAGKCRCQCHHAAGFFIFRLFDCNRKIFGHDLHGLDGPHIADRVGSLIGGSVDRALRPGPAGVFDCSVGLHRMGENVERRRGSDHRRHGDSVERVDDAKGRF